MRFDAHLHRATVRRFLRGETTPAESRLVVGHLLKGCRQCTALAGALWAGVAAGVPERPAKQGGGQSR